MVEQRRTQSRGQRASAPTLSIRGLNVYYGASHALQGVELTLEQGVLSVVGRNGMGKTTLCKTIMGLVPASSGSITFGGQSLIGKTPARLRRRTACSCRLFKQDALTVQDDSKCSGWNRARDVRKTAPRWTPEG